MFLLDRQVYGEMCVCMWFSECKLSVLYFSFLQCIAEPVSNLHSSYFREQFARGFKFQVFFSLSGLYAHKNSLTRKPGYGGCHLIRNKGKWCERKQSQVDTVHQTGKNKRHECPFSTVGLLEK